MKKKIIIVDYGLGNIRSVQNSIQKAMNLYGISGEVERSSNYKSLSEASHIILPGQGAFESCIRGLNDLSGMIEELQSQVIVKKKPILGICVGMQLFSDIGFENGQHKGLGWISGSVIRMPSNKKILPHMGWNEINCLNENPILKKLGKEHFYFVHSYYFEVKNPNNIIAESNYGISFPVAVAKENILGVQFHPEKSADAGIKLLSNFLLLE